MIFLKTIVLTLLIALLCVCVISLLLNFVLRLLHLDITIIKIILFFVIWYFVGPIVYQILLDNALMDTNVILEFIYQPIQFIYGNLL